MFFSRLTFVVEAADQPSFEKCPLFPHADLEKPTRTSLNMTLWLTNLRLELENVSFHRSILQNLD
jgi:hypothetical protein